MSLLKIMCSAFALALLMMSCSKEKELKSRLPVSENYFTYLGTVYQVNPSVGAAWISESSSFNTQSREGINLLIKFKEKPTEDGVYKVKATSLNDPASFAADECSISILSPVAPQLLTSTSREGNTLRVMVVDDKLRVEFGFVEMTYQEGNARKTTNLSGSFFEN
jgi:hypothetical protein